MRTLVVPKSDCFVFHRSISRGGSVSIGDPITATRVVRGTIKIYIMCILNHCMQGLMLHMKIRKSCSLLFWHHAINSRFSWREWPTTSTPTAKLPSIPSAPSWRLTTPKAGKLDSISCIRTPTTRPQFVLSREGRNAERLALFLP